MTGVRPSDEYCVCGKSQSVRRPNGSLYCVTCGKDYHPDNFEPVVSSSNLMDEHGRPYHPDMELSWQTYLGNNGQQQPAEVRRAYIAAWYAAHAYAAGWPDRQSSETFDDAAELAFYRASIPEPLRWDRVDPNVKDAWRKHTQKASEHRHGAAQDFVSYDPEGGVRVDMARYLRSPAGQAQLQELDGQKVSAQRTAAEEWENAKAVMSGEMPPCECTLRDKAPSAYHNAKCPRYVADKL